MSKYRITLEGKTYEMEVELVKENNADQSIDKGEYKEFRRKVKEPTVMVVDPSSERKSHSERAGVVTSPMPGTVVRISKAEGEKVKAGEVVLVLEAMKMENEITAPIDGAIVKMKCKEGKSVNGGAVLFEVQ